MVAILDEPVDMATQVGHAHIDLDRLLTGMDHEPGDAPGVIVAARGSHEPSGGQGLPDIAGPHWHTPGPRPKGVAEGQEARERDRDGHEGSPAGRKELGRFYQPMGDVDEFDDLLERYGAIPSFPALIQDILGHRHGLFRA